MQKLSFKNHQNLTVSEAFEDFIEHCRIKNLRKETIKLYYAHFTIPSLTTISYHPFSRPPFLYSNPCSLVATFDMMLLYVAKSLLSIPF